MAEWNDQTQAEMRAGRLAVIRNLNQDEYEVAAHELRRLTGISDTQRLWMTYQANPIGPEHDWIRIRVTDNEGNVIYFKDQFRGFPSEELIAKLMLIA